MKLIEFKEFNSDSMTPVINKKKVIITICISIVLVLILTFVLLYIYNTNFRRWADTHILMKVVKEGSLSSIDYDKNENVSVYAYDKYIALVNVNKLEIYNSSAKKVASMEVNVTNPIFDTNSKYMVIGDKGKQKVYLVSGTKILWNADIDGSITRVTVNENGYVSVVSMGSTYKSIVSVYNNSGAMLFKRYIPNNTVIDSTVSGDNKYMSFAEVNTSNATIESIVKTVSIKDASEAADSNTVNTYNMPSNALIVSLKYQGSKNLICMCDNGIYTLTDGSISQSMNFEEENKKYSFAGINLSNTIYEIEEVSDGLNNQKSNVILINSSNKKVKTYSIDGIVKETSSSDEKIGINLGNVVYFINSRGWLIKEYVATQEVKNIIVSDRIAAIIFKDKIEILIL